MPKDNSMMSMKTFWNDSARIQNFKHIPSISIPSTPQPIAIRWVKTSAFHVGDIIKFKCFGEFHFSKVTKVNPGSLRKIDGHVSPDGLFTASNIFCQTTKDNLGLGRCIYKLV